MSPMNNRLMRPRASGGTHPEATSWATRVVANGGTVGPETLAAVSRFCSDINSAGIRSLFYRLNLFCGDNLSAALVPLYRAESVTASARGNTIDTNTNFVSGDFNNTGSSSGLKANGSTKFLDTGINANSLTASDAHLGIGLRATDTRSAFFRAAIGAFNNVSTAMEFSVHRLSQETGNVYFTRFNTPSDRFGDTIGGAAGALAVGDIVAAWPSMYRNGAATGATATTSQNYPSAHALYVFALNNSGSSVISYTDARINWYSIGLTMTAAQAAAFTTAVQTFNTTLSRT